MTKKMKWYPKKFINNLFTAIFYLFMIILVLNYFEVIIKTSSFSANITYSKWNILVHGFEYFLK